MNTKIRNLKYSDRRWLKNMIVKMIDDGYLDGIQNIISSNPKISDTESSGEDKNSQLLNIGINVITKMVSHFETQSIEWFADLCGVSPNEFAEYAPFDIEVRIVDQIFEQEDASNFFSGAYRLYNRINEYVKKSGIVKKT